MTRSEALAKAEAQLDQIIQQQLELTRLDYGEEAERAMVPRFAEWRTAVLLQVARDLDDFLAGRPFDSTLH